MNDDEVKVCPFHKMKCEEIRKNRMNIEELKRDTVTRKELKMVEDRVDTKVDWKVLALYISTSLTIFIIIIGIILYETRDAKKEIKNIDRSVNIMQTNQKILMKAFDITPIEPQPKEVK